MGPWISRKTGMMGLGALFLMVACSGSVEGTDSDGDTGRDVPVAGDLLNDDMDPGMADSGGDVALSDLPDSGPDVACECRGNDECTGVFPDLGPCETVVCDPDTCQCIKGKAVPLTPCDDQDPCTTGDLCEDGDCIPGTNECDCATDEDCKAFEDADLCNGTLVCDLEAMPRVCVVDPETVPECIDGDDDPCRGPICEPETGDCVPDQAVAEGEDCDDLDACTEDDVCDQGFCVGETVVVCDDTLWCTTDSCDPDTGCLFAYNTLACEDSEPCTVGDACENGSCVPGAWDLCDDGDDCTADMCISGAGCINTELTGTPCEDGDSCTVEDTCDAGICVGGDAPDCNDEDICTDDSCDPDDGCVHILNTAGCEDGDPCTLDDACFEGQCISGSDKECDDDDPCTDDACDSETGLCDFQVRTIDDGDACTQDACDPITGEITHDPITCDDGDACNGVETCDSSEGCVLGTSLVCDDGDACNGVETCDFDDGCVPGTSLVCDDGDACNGVETCDFDDGCVPGTSLVCDDGDACNGVETCDFDDGCVPGTSLVCNDGNACNGVETCDSGEGCVPGTSLVCDDGNACNGVETCDSGEGCVPGTSLVCDDEDACNGVETCDPGEGCVPGTSLVCDDDDVCTGVFACDSEEGCVEVDAPLSCDDEDACNGLETCDPDLGCQSGTPVVCIDDDPCKDFACNPATGNCDVDLLTGPSCVDEDACTADEVCVLGDCIKTEVCCDDGMDNDGNGVWDCMDAACAAEPSCHDTNVWCRLQGPESLSAIQEQALVARGRLYLAGVTDEGTSNDPRPWLKVQFGYGTEPDAADWSWSQAVPNSGFDGGEAGEPDNDEYVSDTPAPAPSTYSYAFRVSGDNGGTWTYCDLDRGVDHDGSEDGFAIADAGTLTVAVSNVFFSEYVEGSSNNKAVEIYNAESIPVALKHCRVRGYANGSPTQTWAITLADVMLPAGETFVLCHTGWALDGTVCQQTSGGLSFTGDDAVVLDCGGAVSDAIGKVGFDPGTEWGSGLESTSDNTLVRQCSVEIGDRNPSDVFDPATEWDGFENNTASGLGSHVHPCP